MAPVDTQDEKQESWVSSSLVHDPGRSAADRVETRSDVFLFLLGKLGSTRRPFTALWVFFCVRVCVYQTQEVSSLLAGGGGPRF